MSEMFLQLINMSITASWIVLAVILLRVILKKLPKWVFVFLWGLVALRLVFPFSLTGALSLIPSTQTISNQVITGNTFSVNTGFESVDNTVNSYIGDHYYEGVTVPTDNGENVMNILSVIWLAGVALMLVYTLHSYLKIKKQVGEAMQKDKNIYISDKISTPFILGIIKPEIYLPFGMECKDMSYVIAHEKAHIKRLDYIWKPLGFLLLSVYWFNPVLWVAYTLLCKDIELACDEKVIKELGVEYKKDYSTALINCSVSRKMISACPLAFGETGVKSRIKSVLNYKKPAFWVILISCVACVVAAICFLSNPLGTEISEDLSSFISLEIVSQNGKQSDASDFACSDFEIIGVENKLNKTTVYLIAEYQEYSNDRAFKQEYQNEETVAVTVEKYYGKKNGMTYNLIEYWTPTEEYTARDEIKDKFPVRLWSKTLEMRRGTPDCYYNCFNMAVENYGIKETELFRFDLKEKYTSYADVQEDIESVEKCELLFENLNQDTAWREKCREIKEQKLKELYKIQNNFSPAEQTFFKDKQDYLYQHLGFLTDNIIAYDKQIKGLESEKPIDEEKLNDVKERLKMSIEKYNKINSIIEEYESKKNTIKQAFDKAGITDAYNARSLLSYYEEQRFAGNVTKARFKEIQEIDKLTWNFCFDGESGLSSSYYFEKIIDEYEETAKIYTSQKAQETTERTVGNAGSPKLVVKGKNVAAGNSIYFNESQGYAEISLIAVMKELGVSVNRDNGNIAKTTINGSTYTANLNFGTFTKGDSANYLAVAPGSTHGAVYIQFVARLFEKHIQVSG